MAVVLEAVDESGQVDKLVAEKSGVHKGTISKWRRGVTSNPSHRALAAVAKAVGLYWRLVRSNKP
jgi:transcriptional regulator with XRE-family HTH domain